MNKRKETLTGYAFIAPALIVFLVMIAFPFFASIGLSFTEWNFIGGLDKLKWIGFDNYKELLVDRRFHHAVKNTFIYAIATVPTSLVLAMGLAFVMNTKVYFKKTLRLAFFIPYISNTVALSAVFLFLFRNDGLINALLTSVFPNMQPIAWFSSATLCKVPIILLVIWTAIGYEMVIYMAALQNVPRELYEAAEIDGANGFHKFWKITSPLISPTTFYLMIVRCIASFKIFASVNIMTMGTAASYNTSMVNEIYANAFERYKFGYASAEAMIMFLIILAVTLVQFWGQKKWVHY